MSIAETLLIFVGSPVAIVLLVYALVYGTGGRRTSKRYRPGRPFTFAPVWFIAAGDEANGEAAGHAAVTAAPPVPALAAAATGRAGSEQAPVQYGETGGASDSW